jgi:hypothetical protein
MVPQAKCHVTETPNPYSLPRVVLEPGTRVTQDQAPLRVPEDDLPPPLPFACR